MTARIPRVNITLPRDSQDSADRINALVGGVFAAVASDMRGQPASMVYEILDATLKRRLPDVHVDEEAKRSAAARIAIGLPVP